ncbi:MAG: methyltransferase domain-containing protein [Rhizomicrobium sp.]
MGKGAGVVAAFDAAVGRYDGAAEAQRLIGARLLDFCGTIRPRSILDIGCGTGTLLAQAGQKYPQSLLTGLDAAPAMLAAARAKCPQARLICQDAAAIAVAGRFDLILSSMALHWLEQPVDILRRWQGLLSPGGTLMVALPVAGSFAEWRDLCAGAHLTDRLWPFPDAGVFAGLGTGVVEACPLRFDTVRDFLRYLKQTGAHSARPGTSALKPGQMKALLRTAPVPFKTSYQVLYLQMGARLGYGSTFQVDATMS